MDPANQLFGAVVSSSMQASLGDERAKQHVATQKAKDNYILAKASAIKVRAPAWGQASWASMLGCCLLYNCL